MVKQQGREELYDKFDVERAREMLGEVSLRIQHEGFTVCVEKDELLGWQSSM